jgi:hypothetical protein
LLQVRDLSVYRNIKFIQDQFNKEMKLNPSKIKRVNQIDGGDLKESEPRKISR